MAQKESSRDKVIDLASRRRTGKGVRQEIGEHLSTVVLNFGKRLSPEQSALADEVLSELVSDMELALRARLAQGLAQRDDAPKRLLWALVNDEAEVAAPILKQSRLLEDSELIEVITKRSREHRMAITQRDGVSMAVSDALVMFDEEDVIASLLENPSAKLSRRAFEYLAEESRVTERYRKPLVMREDLPAEFAYQIFWWVSGVLRDHILGHFDIPQEVLEAEIEAMDPQDLLASGDPLSTKAIKLALEMEKARELTVDRIVEFIERGSMPLFLAALAIRLNIRLGTVRRIIMDAGGEPLMVLCKTLAMPCSQFLKVQMKLDKLRASAPRSLDYVSRLGRSYDSISESSALAVLRFWDETPSS